MLKRRDSVKKPMVANKQPNPLEAPDAGIGNPANPTKQLEHYK